MHLIVVELCGVCPLGPVGIIRQSSKNSLNLKFVRKIIRIVAVHINKDGTDSSHIELSQTDQALTAKKNRLYTIIYSITSKTSQTISIV